MTGGGHSCNQRDPIREDGRSGFALVEFLISASLLLLVASSVFGLLSEIQRKSGYETEVQAVLNSTRLAMHTVGRYLRQAGNDPLGTGLTAISLAEASRVGIRSDLTGSESPGYPDKGDPDGDTLDSGEEVIIRYNSATRSLEIVPGGGSAQIIAGYISSLSFAYYDAEGRPAATGGTVQKVRVTISGTSLLGDPYTNRKFGIQLTSDFQTGSE
jgi:type II secretory pathway pseudopilin PulG